MPQGTIRSFDATTGEGVLLDDELDEHVFDREQMRASGLRELRIGQRMRFVLDGERVTQLNIVSL
jgi:cold shock CspA family protein